jgi:fibronectin type 3 domain-containing protein
MIASAGACVSLSKPPEVAKCAATGTCVDHLKDAAPLDTGGAPDGSRPIDGEPTYADGPYSKDGDDGAKPNPSEGGTNGDGGLPPVLDDGGAVLPDAEDAVMVPPDGDQPGQPGDVPSDRPPATPDAGDARVPDGGPGDGTTDVVTGSCVTNGVLKSAGTPCRPAAGLCDVAETCDGLSNDCPADKLAAAGKECRPAAGDCDVAETCTGTSVDCPADVLKQAGTVCRAAAGVCDYAEICSGDSAACPSDSLKQSTSVCREATNVCDPAENCTGLGASCPQDVPPYARPAAPATLTATPGELQATLSWSAVAGATGYNIKRATAAGGPYTTIATGVLTTSYVDKGLDSSKTYYYVISAVNTIAACESAANSPEASVKPTGTCTKPAAPTVTATPGNGQVTLTWEAVAGATAYAIDRSETSGTGYASLAQVTAPTTTYLDVAVTFGKTYYYRVTTKGTCDSDPSTEVSAAPLCAPAATAPAGLTATTPDTGGVVVLTWTAVAGARTTDRYYVMRKLSTAATYTEIDEVVPPTTTYSDTTAVNGTTYSYAVTFFNGTCTSGNSNVVTTTPVCVMGKPVLTLTPGNKKVDLAWTQPTNGSLTGYRVYRGTTLVATLTGAGTTTYSDTGLTNGTTYTYYVTAVGNCNADSDPKSAAPVCTPLAAPTNLKATTATGQVTLNWDAVTGADHYTVSRAGTAGGPYTALTPASPITTNSYTDSGLTNGTTYYYVVSVSNGSCDSSNSNEASATPQSCPSQGAPGKPTLAVNSYTQVQIDWTAATPTPPSGYTIMRSTSATGPFTSIDSVGGSVLTYIDRTSSLTVGTTYYYEISANTTSCSTPSASTSIDFACKNPSAPSPNITANANGSITLSWGTTGGATVYTVSRNTAATGTFTNISTGTALSYTDSTGLTNGTVYYYKVTAGNATTTTLPGGQCTTASAVVSIRACIIPAAPGTPVVARRSGNKQVTVAWTNSTNATSYEVRRSTTNGSGYGTVVTVSGSPGVDSSAANNTAYYYVVTARSDANCPASGNSAQASVPSCVVVSGSTSQQKQNDNSEWCIVTCDDISWWSDANLGDRTLYINTVQTSKSGAMPLPAKANSGYAFYFTAASSGSGGNYAYWNDGVSATHGCP